MAKGKGGKASKAKQAQLDQEAAAALKAAEEAEAAAQVGRGGEGVNDGRGKWEHRTGGHNHECQVCGAGDEDMFPCSFCNLTWCAECLAEVQETVKPVSESTDRFCCEGCYSDAVTEHNRSRGGRAAQQSKRQATKRNKESAAAVNDSLALGSCSGLGMGSGHGGAN